MSSQESFKMEVWNNLDYKNGRKFFGNLEAAVQSTTETSSIQITDRPPKLSIIIPTMERTEKTLHTIQSIGLSASKADLATELIIVDNSFTPHLHDIVRELTKDTSNKENVFNGIDNLIYHFDSRLTFPMARNTGLEMSSSTSEYIGSWDSDIYCGENLLTELFKEWEQRDDYAGLAPSLMGFRDQSLEDAISDLPKSCKMFVRITKPEKR